MTDVPDADLLEQYARDNSEAAFGVLVDRHIGLVYSVAMRHTANHQHAQDISQAVFIILARKAKSLGRKTVLAGWLYHAARYTTANFLRGEASRLRREQEVFMQSTQEENAPDNPWEELSPVLDDAIGRLASTDRDAIVLRYFQNKSLPEVGFILGLEERTAQKRVVRAVEKLRKLFIKQGIGLSSLAITQSLSMHSIQAAPAAVAKTISVVAIAKGVGASGSALTLVHLATKMMTWASAKTALFVGAGLLALAGTSVILINKAQTIATPPPPTDRAAAFREFIENPPWIKHVVFRESGNHTMMSVEGGKRRPLKEFAVYEGALQPNGYYVKYLSNTVVNLKMTSHANKSPHTYVMVNPPPGIETVQGENRSNDWEISTPAHLFSISPREGDEFSLKNLEVIHSKINHHRLNAMRRLGMDILADAELRWTDLSHFAGTCTNGPVSGEIVAYAQGRPFVIKYSTGPPKRIRRFEVHFFYKTDDDLLPNQMVSDEIGGDGRVFTDFVDELELGEDPAKTEGYQPSDFPAAYADIQRIITDSNGARFSTSGPLEDSNGIGSTTSGPIQESTLARFAAGGQQATTLIDETPPNREALRHDTPPPRWSGGIWFVGLAALLYLTSSAVRKMRARG